VAVPAAAVPTNTTAFAFWPDLNTINDDIPVAEDSGEDATLEDPTGETLSHEIRRRERARERRRQTKWLAAGLAFPDKEGAGRRWFGVRHLGQGATGRIGLWISTTAQNIINEVR
jgi:hypothetical protein